MWIPKSNQRLHDKRKTNKTSKRSLRVRKKKGEASEREEIISGKGGGTNKDPMPGYLSLEGKDNEKV